MYKKLKKVSKSRNKLIAVVTVLFIGMIFASVLLGTIATDISYGDEDSHASSVADERETDSKLDTSATSGKISINDAGSNNWAWAKAQGICTGSGTYADPYVIEGRTINCGGSGSGIKIKNSNVYFIIRYCTIYNSGTDTNAGIKLINTDNGFIQQNDCSQNSNGIYLETSNNNYIGFSNTFNNNDYGIYLKTSNNNYILANTANDNNLCGMWIQSSNGNTIWGNAANGNGYVGIILLASDDNMIWTNSAKYNVAYGIWINEGNNNKIKRNNANDNIWGIQLSSSSGNEISENNANNNYNTGIRLDYCNGNSIWGNTAKYNGLQGVLLTQCTGIYMMRNKVVGTPGVTTYGVEVIYGNGNAVIQTTISDCQYGIYLYYTNNNYAWWNTLIRCQQPIKIVGGSGNSLNGNTIIP